MRKTAFLFLILISYCKIGLSLNETNFNIGEIIEIESKILNETRVLNIYLPENYQEQDSINYNTIYLLDGTSNEDFLHIVGLLQFFELQFNIEPTILVGIANIDRKRDFTFETDIEELKTAFPSTGKSAKFIEREKPEFRGFKDRCLYR